MKPAQQQNISTRRRLIGLAAVTAAVAVTPLAPAAQTDDMVTISLSGATFMRNFTTSAGITLLTPGTSITLNSGAGGTPVTYTATYDNDPGPGVNLVNTTSFQLSPTNATSGFVTTGANQVHPAIRTEWHEQGSIEGVLEMINDQISPVTSVGLTNRNASTGNPTWISRNSFTSVPQTLNNYPLNTSTYNPNFGGGTFDDSNPARPGTNIQGGQNRVQMAISDVNAKQGFSVAGTAAYNRTPGSAGYGKGNPNLRLQAPGDLQGLGGSGVRHEMNPGSVANMTGADPTTGAAYASGPWNTAGVDNLHNTTVANGGLTMIANPGTGLERINRTDAQWLHATGRLQNGADFNVATRDAYSGTINTAVTNVGLDVSWATGENDDGNGNGTGGGNTQTRIGSGIKFSNKTSGSSQVRPTVQNSRMGFGHLTSSESVSVSTNANSRPLRVLEYRDDTNDVADDSNDFYDDGIDNGSFSDPITGNDAAKDIFNGFTRMGAKSLVEGSYTLRTNQTYVTVKAPDAAFAGDTPAQWAARTDDAVTGTGIKGDNSGDDVYDFRKNILDAIANFPPTSVANPADELLAKGFILTKMVKVTKAIDGVNQDVTNPEYNASLSGAFLSSSYVTAFNAGDPRSVKQGTGGTYGNNNIGSGSGTPVGGSIAITANNYLFGDFDQTGGEFNAGSNPTGKKGIRDFSDLYTAQQAQAALHTSGLGTSWDVNAGSNSTAVAGTGISGFSPTKGDLIVLGDFDSDGDFDGKDLYRVARGAALSDSTSTDTLTASSGNTFGDMARRGVLRKNAALDWLNTNATAQQKADASFDGIASGDDTNAFNKFDVNRDGNLDLEDGGIVDAFVGSDYRDLDDQLAAVVATNLDPAGTRFIGNPLDPGNTTSRKPISLVDVELTDTGDITSLGVSSDFGLIKTALGSLLKVGDTDFDNDVDLNDLSSLAANYGSAAGSKWSKGDFDLDGDVDLNDLSGLAAFYGSGEAQAFADFQQLAAVPEPGGIAITGLIMAGLASRRRRGQRSL